MAVRTAMEHPIGALPCTPFASSRRSPQGETRSMERKNRRVIYFMYHSGVFPFGGERSEPITRVLIMPYDIASQSRNVLASPLGEKGHEVAKGWTVVILIVILDVDVTAEGGIIKLIAREGNPPPFEPYEPFEPSHRRCVQCCPPAPSSRAGLHVGMGQMENALMIL